MSIGTNTYIDKVLAEYQPPAAHNQGLVGELMEDETNALLFALLMEQRGDDVLLQETAADRENAEATYECLSDVSVTSDTDSKSWGYPAGTVMLYGFDAPIKVAFKEDGSTNRWIPLDPEAGDEPATFSPGGGLDAAQIWFQRAGDADTSMNVVAFD